jgi:hypothetical protein
MGAMLEDRHYYCLLTIMFRHLKAQGLSCKEARPLKTKAESRKAARMDHKGASRSECPRVS